MSNLVQLTLPENTSVKDALSAALEDCEKLNAVIIIAYEDDCLYIRSSKMDRKSALWMLEQAKIYALSTETRNL